MGGIETIEKRALFNPSMPLKAGGIETIEIEKFAIMGGYERH
jgi:hypothetical protein